MLRVLFTPTLSRNSEQPYFSLLSHAGFEVVFPPLHATMYDPDSLVALLAQVDAAIVSTEPITAGMLEKCPRLRVLARWGVGYDSIDMAAATRANIVVTITPGVLEESVAEHALAMLLCVSRGLVGRDREVRAGAWSRAVLPRAAGKILGLIGFGRIGKALAVKAHALGMRLLACDPFANPQEAALLGVRLVPLNELLATADFVSLHAPSSAATRELINRDTLAQMKRGAILVNTARGTLVNENDLAASLRSKHLLGAALDVFQSEPLAKDSPLNSIDNVLLCTHMGGLDDETVREAPRAAAQCILDLHAGRWPDANVVNRELAPGWKW